MVGGQGRWGHRLWQTRLSGPVNSGINPAMTVQLQGGTFLIGSAITPPVNDFVGWTLQGMGRIATTLQRTPGFTGTFHRHWHE